MARIDDHDKLTPEEQAALEQYVREHPGSTLLKDERTARYIQRERRKERGEAPARAAEIEAHARQQEKYGSPDWTHFSELEGTRLSIPLRLPKRPSAALWDALGQFVNLSDDGLDGFREQYPSFFPTWLYSLTCGSDAEVNAKTGLLAWQAWRALLREAWHSGFHPEYVAQLVNVPTVAPGNTRFEVQPVCDAQRAVLAIALESWRARFCPKCGFPFVARKPADKYWPRACFVEQRREKQRASKRNRTWKRRDKLQKDGRRTKR